MKKLRAELKSSTKLTGELKAVMHERDSTNQKVKHIYR